MKSYNVHEAKTHLSKILNEVQEGETVYLAKAGEIVAELRPVMLKDRSFKLGAMRDKIWLADDWNSEETNKAIADSLFQEDVEEPDSQDEIEGEAHPKYRTGK